MSQHTRMQFTLHISSERFLSYYRGSVRNVLTRAADGRTLSFPANLLQPHVRHDGVHGTFELELDADNRCVSLSRLGD